MGRVAVAKDKPKDCMEDRVILRPRKLDCGPPGAPFREPPKPPFVARPEGPIEDRPSDWLENCIEEPARESPSRTGLRTELSTCGKPGWKIEGKTEGKLGLRTGLRVGIELCIEEPGRNARLPDRSPAPSALAEDPFGGAACGRGEGPPRRPN